MLWYSYTCAGGRWANEQGHRVQSALGFCSPIGKKYTAELLDRSRLTFSDDAVREADFEQAAPHLSIRIAETSLLPSEQICQILTLLNEKPTQAKHVAFFRSKVLQHQNLKLPVDVLVNIVEVAVVKDLTFQVGRLAWLAH